MRAKAQRKENGQKAYNCYNSVKQAEILVYQLPDPISENAFIFNALQIT